MAEAEDFSTLKERAKKKLERDMGPLLVNLTRSETGGSQPAIVRHLVSLQ